MSYFRPYVFCLLSLYVMHVKTKTFNRGALKSQSIHLCSFPGEPYFFFNFSIDHFYLRAFGARKNSWKIMNGVKYFSSCRWNVLCASSYISTIIRVAHCVLNVGGYEIVCDSFRYAYSNACTGTDRSAGVTNCICQRNDLLAKCFYVKRQRIVLIKMTLGQMCDDDINDDFDEIRKEILDTCCT